MSQIGDPNDPLGVGTLMHNKLKKLGADVTCPKCKAMVAKMNTNGPDWCEENIAALISIVYLNAQENQSVIGAISRRAPEKLTRQGIKITIKQKIALSRKLKNAI